jgi:urease accessory protein UreF
VAFGLVARAAAIEAQAAMTGYLYTRLAATVSASMRLMAIGQHDAHARLAALLACVPETVEAIVAGDARLRSFTPAMDIAAMRQQYGESRLFRS